MRGLRQRALRGGRYGLACALLALAAHGAAYHSFFPSDAVHGYFGWYQPLIGGLSAVAVVGLVSLLVCAAAGIEPRHLRAVVPEPGPVRSTAARLGAGSLLLLVVQETIERSAASGVPEPVRLSPGAWIVLLAAIAAGSAALALLARWYRGVRRRLSNRHPGPRPSTESLRLRAPAPRSSRRDPAASGGGMRAPPPLLA